MLPSVIGGLVVVVLRVNLLGWVLTMIGSASEVCRVVEETLVDGHGQVYASQPLGAA